ncbi:MAG: apolipoprotein N-acyltransferase [bacterium]
MTASRRAYGLAAAGGVLHFLGFVGYGIWPLALICLVPLWLALDGALPRRALCIGAVFGWVSYAGGFLWLWPALQVLLDGNAALGAMVWLADSGWFALRWALYAALFAALRRRRWPVAAAGVPSLVVVEWLYPMLFPVYFGHALAERIALIQIADLGGPLLLTAFLTLLNAAAFELWGWRGGARGRVTLAAAALALLGTWGYGVARIATIDRLAGAGAQLRVGIVQGNLGVQEKGVRAAHDHQRYLEQSRALLADGAVDLLIWPETVYSRGLRGPLPISGHPITADLPVPLLFGGAYVDPADDRRTTYNAALLVEPDGVIRRVYRKNLLIPFSEYVPFGDLLPTLAQRLASPSHFAAATDVTPLQLGAWRLSTPICYEAVRPAFVRRMMREARPHLLISLANDAWFGDSQEPALHLDMARLRAVEVRRYLVRATNSGISAVIDPVGRDVVRSAVQHAENLRATVRMLDEDTVYTRWGDWLGALCAMAVLFGVLAGRRRPSGG